MSILRHERAAANEEKATPRRRIERAETADRKGRAVTVERIVAPPKQGEPSSRNSRRFAEWKGLERDHRPAAGPAGKRGKDGRAGRPTGPKPSGGPSSGGRPRGRS